MPALRDLLKDIPVIYALELVEEEGNGNAKITAGLLTETKVRAMRAAVTEFYSRYPGQSWKNIISIGDALYEHTAIRQVVGERPMEEKCRTKTVKLLDSP